jgi:hypothetical protein
LQTVLDELWKMRAAERTGLGNAALGAVQSRSPIGLRFAPGARVVDLTSGLRGLVQYGDRDPHTSYERFRVQLVDARIVYRSERELEPLRERGGQA